MHPARSLLVLALVAAIGAAAPAAAEHSYGQCVPTPAEACERWVAVLDDASIAAPARSDQFGAGSASNATTVFVVAKDVAFNTSDAYSSSSRALVSAYDKTSGAVRWSVRRSDRSYLSPHAVVVSPDGRVLYVTGAAYNGFPVGATDSRVATTAFDASTGRELWTATWDGRPDATDNGNYIAVAPDGSEVYVSGVTTSADGDLDIVTLGYSASDGRQLWSSIYAGPKPKGQDAVFGLAVSPQADMVYVTGWSDSPAAEYDADYVTVAYALGHRVAGASAEDADCDPGHGHGHGKGLDKKCPPPPPPPPPSGPAAGQQMWVARYDGLGVHKSDRANAIAVDPAGKRVYVTGDSYSVGSGASYGYATVAYDAVSGSQLWQARYDGGRGGFNSADQIVATATRVLVSGQATAADSVNGNDATTVGYDASTGQQIWTASVAPARSDDYARDLEVSPDGRTAFLLADDTPLVDYTALTTLTVTAYAVADGAASWTSNVDGGALNSLHGSSLAISPGGDEVSAVGELKRSANPVGAPSQNIYDLVVTSFAS